MHFALLIMASLCLFGLAHSKSVAQFNPDGKGIKVPTISIVGGTPAAEGEFSYVTVLRLGRFLCGGSLIGPSYVLTAAHCLGSFTQANVTSFFVLINTLLVDGGGPNSVVGRVRKFIIHEAYNPRNNNNDVALLVLSSPVAANSSFLNLPTDQAVTTLKPTTVKPTTKTTAKPITTKAPACSCTCPTTKTTKRAVTTKTTKRAVAVTTKTTKKPTAIKTTKKPVAVKTTKKPAAVPVKTTKKPTAIKTTKKPVAVKTTKKPVAVTVKTTKKPTAIKTTKKPVGVKTTKKPAAVLRAFSTYTNVSATIAGWGTTSFGGSISSTLLKANVTILDNSICSRQYGTTFVPANMLCAAAPGTDTCQGDSGGPIFVNGVVVGITSFGNGCADPRFAGVYARVSAYVGWIQTTQANNP